MELGGSLYCFFLAVSAFVMGIGVGVMAFWLYVDWVTSVEPPAVLTALAQIVGPQKLVEAIEAGGRTINADRTTGVS